MSDTMTLDRPSIQLANAAAVDGGDNTERSYSDFDRNRYIALWEQCRDNRVMSNVNTIRQSTISQQHDKNKLIFSFFKSTAGTLVDGMANFRHPMKLLSWCFGTFERGFELAYGIRHFMNQEKMLNLAKANLQGGLAAALDLAKLPAPLDANGERLKPIDIGGMIPDEIKAIIPEYQHDKDGNLVFRKTPDGGKEKIRVHDIFDFTPEGAPRPRQ